MEFRIYPPKKVSVGVFPSKCFLSFISTHQTLFSSPPHSLPLFLRWMPLTLPAGKICTQWLVADGQTGAAAVLLRLIQEVFSSANDLWAFVTLWQIPNWVYLNHFDQYVPPGCCFAYAPPPLVGSHVWWTVSKLQGGWLLEDKWII